MNASAAPALARPVLRFDPLMTALHERSVPGKVMVVLRLRRIDQLLARRARPVEKTIGYHGFRICQSTRVSNLAADPPLRADSFRNSRPRQAARSFRHFESGFG